MGLRFSSTPIKERVDAPVSLRRDRFEVLADALPRGERLEEPPDEDHDAFDPRRLEGPDVLRAATSSRFRLMILSVATTVTCCRQ